MQLDASVLEERPHRSTTLALLAAREQDGQNHQWAAATGGYTCLLEGKFRVQSTYDLCSE